MIPTTVRPDNFKDTDPAVLKVLEARKNFKLLEVFLFGVMCKFLYLIPDVLYPNTMQA